MKTKITATDIAITIAMVLLGTICVVPFVNVIAESLSGENAVISGQVGLVPVDFTISAYNFLINNRLFYNAFFVSVLVTILGTAISLFLLVITAYPLSVKDFKANKIFMNVFVFAMLFIPGIVPSYMMMNILGLLNNPLVLIVPGLLSIFNLFIMRNFMSELPDELSESSKIDGANDLQILFKIIVPLCKPVIATLSLFLIVTFWNNFMPSVLYISNQDYKPLQHYLYDLITSASALEQQAAAGSVSMEEMNFAADSIRSAAVILSAIPIMCVYPYLQKYFVKGLTIGAVKG